MSLRQKVIRAVQCVLIGLVFWFAVMLLAGQILGLLIGPVGDQIEYDKPTDPEALRRYFHYLSAVWARCTPLGYTRLNLDADVYVAEADCKGGSTLAAIREAFRQDLAIQEPRALWVLEGANWFAIAWPCSIPAKSCEPSESTFVIDGSRLILLSGELICRKGRVAKRERSYRRALQKYLKEPPPLLGGIPCFEPYSQQDKLPQRESSVHHIRGRHPGWTIRRQFRSAEHSTGLSGSSNPAEAT